MSIITLKENEYFVSNKKINLALLVGITSIKY